MSDYDIKHAIETTEQTTEALKGFIEKHSAQMMEVKDRLAEVEQKTASPVDFHDAPKGISIGKVLKHLSNPSEFPLDGKEREWHQELSRKNDSQLGGVFVPLQTKAGVDYNTSSPTSGASNIIPTRTLDLIDVLRQESTVMRQGVTMIPAQGNVSIPRKSADSTAYWFSGDGGDSITESNPTFDAVTLTPKFVGGLVTVSYKMMLQSGNEIDRIISQDLMGMIGEEIDLKALQGDGTNDTPVGVLNASGVTDVGWGMGTSPLTVPTAFHRQNGVHMETTLISNKALKGNLSFLFDPATYLSLQGQRDSTGQPVWGMDPEGRTLLGYNVTATSAMPSSTALFGNWAEFLVANYGGIELAMDDGGTNFPKGTRSIRAIMPIDFGVRHGASFVKAAQA